MTGWRRDPKIYGKPDFIFKKEKLAIFVDGCFWHGCPSHHKKPTTRAEFWETKIGRNIQRDRIVSRTLRADGWAVIRIWECKLRDYPLSEVKRVNRKLRELRAQIEASKTPASSLVK
ncbi:very short patch repair endonuclease [Opitutus sp. WL0086]|uniref:very short patch repair endonuclease n=1 Tax=Actomonas aquatica TaxID=2866162 RepID=UPI001C80F20C